MTKFFLIKYFFWQKFFIDQKSFQTKINSIRCQKIMEKGTKGGGVSAKYQKVQTYGLFPQFSVLNVSLTLQYQARTTTFPETFVHATFVLGTDFFNQKKIFWQKLFLPKICFDQNFFRPKVFFDQKFYSIKISIWPKNGSTQNFFSIKNFFDIKIFSIKKFFLQKFFTTKIFFWQKFCTKKFFLPKSFLDKKFVFFRPQVFFRSIFVFHQKFVRQKITFPPPPYWDIVPNFLDFLWHVDYHLTFSNKIFLTFLISLVHDMPEER